MRIESQEGKDLAVGDGLVVSLAYQLRLDDGEEIDAAAAADPLVYLHGAGNIIPGLERELDGMRVGESKRVTVSPEDGYGDMDPDAFELMPYDVFPTDLELEEGLEMRLVDNTTGQQIQAYVSELREEGVLLDLNHPLAGETLFFDVEVVSLRAATPEEQAHGHAHTHGHTH